MDIYRVEVGSPITITQPAGLFYYIETIDVHGAGTVTVSGVTSGTIKYFDTYNGELKLQYKEDTVITVDAGYANIGVINAGGDQNDQRIFDTTIRPNSKAWYPGKWGSGIGSK